MKFKNLLSISLVSLCLVACKKESPIIEPPSLQKPDPLELLKDSMSYSIDAKQMINAEIMTKGLINAESNIKLDSLVK